MSKIAYDLKKIKAMVFDIDGVLSPGTIPVRDNGVPRRMANMKDGLAMALAKREGLKIMILSGAVSPGMRERFERIGITDFYEGKMDKLPVLKAWMAREEVEPEEVAYMGDDLPDIPPMLHVGLPVTPADGSRDTMIIAKYITEAAGGYGAARELIEEIMRAQEIWPGLNGAII